MAWYPGTAGLVHFPYFRNKKNRRKKKQANILHVF